MEFNTFQIQAITLAMRAWPDDCQNQQTADSLMARLAEEVGELSRAVRQYGQGRWGHPGEAPGDKHAVADELGDVLFLLARVADLTGVHLSDAALQVVDKLNYRVMTADCYSKNTSSSNNATG